jgi:hypothetical protein
MARTRFWKTHVESDRSRAPIDEGPDSRRGECDTWMVIASYGQTDLNDVAIVDGDDEVIRLLPELVHLVALGPILAMDVQYVASERHVVASGGLNGTIFLSQVEVGAGSGRLVFPTL